MDYFEQVIADRLALQKKHNLSALSPELTEKFEELSCSLSIANLSIIMKTNQIMREWKALEKQAGRKVLEEEFPY